MIFSYLFETFSRLTGSSGGCSKINVREDVFKLPQGKVNQLTDALKKIIENKKLTMREDLMCFARVLSLVAHYEAGMDYHLDVQLYILHI